MSIIKEAVDTLFSSMRTSHFLIMEPTFSYDQDISIGIAIPENISEDINTLIQHLLNILPTDCSDLTSDENYEVLLSGVW